MKIGHVVMLTMLDAIRGLVVFTVEATERKEPGSAVARGSSHAKNEQVLGKYLGR